MSASSLLSSAFDATDITTETTLIAAPDAGTYVYVLGYSISTTNAFGGLVKFRRATAGSLLLPVYVPQNEPPAALWAPNGSWLMLSASGGGISAIGATSQQIAGTLWYVTSTSDLSFYWTRIT